MKDLFKIICVVLIVVFIGDILSNEAFKFNNSTDELTCMDKTDNNDEPIQEGALFWRGFEQKQSATNVQKSTHFNSLTLPLFSPFTQTVRAPPY